MELIQIKNEIEKMNKNHQIEIFKIIHKNKIDFNENNNGIFINLTNLEDGVLYDIKEYILFVSKQNIFLNEQEELKENYINSYFKNNVEEDESINQKQDEQKPSEPSLPSYAI